MYFHGQVVFDIPEAQRSFPIRAHMALKILQDGDALAHAEGADGGKRRIEAAREGKVAQRARRHDLPAKMRAGKGVLKAQILIKEEFFQMHADLPFRAAREIAQDAAVDERFAQKPAVDFVDADVRLDDAHVAAALQFRA